MKRSKAPSSILAKRKDDKPLVRTSFPVSSASVPAVARTSAPVVVPPPAPAVVPPPAVSCTEPAHPPEPPYDENIPVSTLPSTINKIAPKGKSGGFKTPFKSPTTSATTAIVKAHQQKEKEDTKAAAEPDIYYTVMWCNYSTKKHKTYNDGMF